MSDDEDGAFEAHLENCSRLLWEVHSLGLHTFVYVLSRKLLRWLQQVMSAEEVVVTAICSSRRQLFSGAIQIESLSIAPL